MQRSHTGREALFWNSLFFSLGYERLRLRNIPARRLPEPMPEIMKRPQVTRLHQNHTIIRRTPNMRILTHNSHVLRQSFLEPFPVNLRLLLVQLRQGPNTVEDQEREYQTRNTPPARGRTWLNHAFARKKKSLRTKPRPKPAQK